MPLPAQHAEFLAQQRGSQRSPSPKPFGSLVSEAPLDRNSQDVPLGQNEQQNELRAGSAGGAVADETVTNGQQPPDDFGVRSSFGSIFLPADSGAAVAEKAAAAAAAAHPAAPTSPQPVSHRHGSSELFGAHTRPELAAAA